MWTTDCLVNVIQVACEFGNIKATGILLALSYHILPQWNIIIYRMYGICHSLHIIWINIERGRASRLFKTWTGATYGWQIHFGLFPKARPCGRPLFCRDAQCGQALHIRQQLVLPHNLTSSFGWTSYFDCKVTQKWHNPYFYDEKNVISKEFASFTLFIDRKEVSLQHNYD